MTPHATRRELNWPPTQPHRHLPHLTVLAQREPHRNVEPLTAARAPKEIGARQLAAQLVERARAEGVELVGRAGC
jgi:hypothetical protein